MSTTSLYALRAGLGQCGKCGRPPAPGGALCEDCRRRVRETGRRNRMQHNHEKRLQQKEGR